MFTRAEKEVSTALLKVWREADVRQDDETAEYVKRTLDMLRLPWVPIKGDEVDRSVPHSSISR
jgi:hypothetical protein